MARIKLRHQNINFANGGSGFTHRQCMDPNIIARIKMMITLTYNNNNNNNDNRVIKCPFKKRLTFTCPVKSIFFPLVLRPLII